MEARAYDIAMSNQRPGGLRGAAREAGFLGFGFYPRSGFMHIDLGPKRQWGERFAPADERLAESRMIKSSGVAGVATVGAAGARSRRRCCPRRRTRSSRSCRISTTRSAGCSSPRRSPASLAIYARLDDWKRGRR